jgi:hypothetical protein
MDPATRIVAPRSQRNLAGQRYWAFGKEDLHQPVYVVKAGS